MRLQRCALRWSTVALIAAMVLAATETARGTDYYWINPYGGDFSNGSNWDLNQMPQSDDRAFFDLASATYTVTFPAGYSYLNDVLMIRPSNDVTFASSGGTTQTYNSDVVDIQGTFTLGNPGNPLNLATNNFWVYQSGVLNVNFGTITTTSLVNYGTVSQTGGTMTGNGQWVITGAAPGAAGTYNLSAGKTVKSSSDTYQDLLIGNGGSGTTGTLNLSGAGWLDIQSDEIMVGEGSYGNGTLTMSGNSKITMNTTATSFNYFYIGRLGATGVMTMSDNAILQKTSNQPIVVGGGWGEGGGGPGNGTLTMNNNASITASGEFWIGEAGGSVGTVTLNNSSSITTNNWFCVGRENSGGNATLNVNGGTITKNGAGNFIVGSLGGTGAVYLNSGAIYNNGDLVIGENSGAAANFHLNGGLVQAKQVTQYTSDGNPAFSNLYLNGGTLQSTISTDDFINANLSVKIQTGGAILDTNGNDVTIQAQLQEDGSHTGGALTKLGTGTLTLSGANSYTGGTIINGGKLRASTGGSLGSGLVTFNGGALGVVSGVGYSNQLRVNDNVTGTVLCQVVDAYYSRVGSLTMGNNAQFYFGPDSNTQPDWPGGLSVDGAMLNGDATFNVDNFGASLGTLRIWALYDGETPRTITKLGPGFLALDWMAVGVSDGTQINVAAGTLGCSDPLALGTGAKVDVATGALFQTAGEQIVAALSGHGTVTIYSNAALTIYTPSGLSLDFAGDIEGDLYSNLVKNGPGTQILSGANNYYGATTISGGILSVSLLANGGTASGIGSSSNSAGNLIIDGGALKYIGAGNSTDRLFTLTQNGSILDASGTGAVILSNTGSVAFSGSGARTLTLTGTNIGNNTLAASIGDGSGGATSLVKSGTGTWILTGTSAYTGATTISNGILEVGILQNGGTASGIGSSSNSAGNLIIDGGALKYIGAGNSTNRHFTLTQNNGALDASGAGAVSFSSSSSVAFSGSGARTLTLTGTNTGNNTLAASIGDGSGGATSLVKSGTGTWILTGSNGYTGNTLIGGGTLVTKKSASLPGYNAPGKVTVNEGGTIAVRAGASTGEWADWEIDALRIHAVFNSGSFLGIDTTSNNFSYNSAIGGSLGLTKLGSNTLTLTASNTYTGGTIINAGTLRLSGGYDRLSTIGAITITGGVLDIDLYTHQQTSGDVSFQGGTVQNGTIIKSGAPYDGRAGTISAILAGSAGLTKTTTGTLTLTGTNSYSGGTTIMDGMLQLSGGDDRLSTSGAITISGGVLDLSGYSQTTFGAVSIQGGTVQNGTLITSGADFNGQTGTVSMALAGSVGLTKTTTGTLTLIASNTYSGGTTISGGTLEAGILNNGGMASGIGSSPNGASNLIIDGGTLKYIGAGNSTDRLFTLTQNGGALDASGAGAVNFTSTGSELSYGSGARTITLTGTNTSNNTLAASIGDGSGGSGGSVKSTTFLDEPTTSLVKSGSGTWVITGTNSYSGGTTIMDGTLQLSGGDDRLSTTGAIMIYGGVFDLCGNIQHTSAVVIFGRELDLGGTGQHPYGSTIFQGGDSPDNGSKIVNNGADYDGRCGTIGTDLEGAAGLAKTTGGTLTLYCSTGNSYVGVTTVRDGILIVSMLANGGLNSGLGASSSAASNLVLNGGTLKYTGGAVSTDRRFQLGLGATAGTLDASGTGAVNWTYNGPMEFYGSETILRTLTLTGTNTDDNTLAASIRNPSANTTSLTKTGTGAWILSGSNTYTGATTISGGTLELASTGQISTASAIINDATFQILGGTHAVGNITGAGTTKVIDNGILTVNSITQNTLQIGAGSLLTIAPIGGGPLADVGTMTAVPEPSTWAMLILAAMGGLEIYRRRRLCAAVAGDDQESFPHPPA